MKKFISFETQLGESALDLTDKAKLSLYKKSQNSGYSIDILEEVYRRGYRCWTEAFGGNAEQFAFDRVNSFIAGGFAADLDEDLLDEKRGLWDNIHAKRARIKAGSGERMRKPGSEGAPTDAALKASQNEDTDPCWKNYKQVGMKMKGGKKVPNCVPVKEELKSVPSPEAIAKKFKKPEDAIEKAIKSGSKVEKEHTRDQKTAEKIATAHVNEYPNYYKKLSKAGLEEDAEKHSKNPDDPASRFIGSDELVDIYKKETPGQIIKKVVKEATAYVPPPTYDVTAGKPQSGYSRTAPTSARLNQPSANEFRNTSSANPSSRSLRSGTGSARASIGGQGGYSSASQQLKPTSMSTRTPTSFSATRSVPTPDSRLSASGGGSMKPTSVSSKAPTFSQGGGMQKMGDKLTDMTRKMDKGFVPSNQMGQTLAKGFGKTAADVASKLGKIAGPVGVAAEVMKSTPAGEKKSEFERQAELKSYNPYKASGRSVSDYEKQLGLDKPITNTPVPAANPKVDAPLPPSRPEYFSRGQAFSAAREKAGGGQGQFSYDNKPFQTNVKGEPYIAPSKQKPTGVEAESGKIKKIKEAIAEATYQGKKVPLNKPMAGDVKKSKVFVDPDGDGKAQKVNFGDKNMSIKKNQPARKKSYCARSGGQGNLTDKSSANYWSRRAWNCEETEVPGGGDE